MVNAQVWLGNLVIRFLEIRVVVFLTVTIVLKEPS